jgi:PAS domain S-box-containing protein
MEEEDLLVRYAHGPWEQREEFLLLPGDGLILISGNGLICFFDNRARLRLGTVASQACGQPVDTIWPELAELLEHHSIGVDQQGPRDTQVDLRGQPQAVRLFRTDDGMGVVLLGDRSAVQGIASQQLLMHQQILRQLRDSVIVTTAEPIDLLGPLIVYANPAALAQTGYSLDEVLGRSPRLFQGPGTDPASVRSFREAMNHWQPVRQTVLNYRRSGRAFWVEIDITPLSDRDGWYTFWVSVQRECKGPIPS